MGQTAVSCVPDHSPKPMKAIRTPRGYLDAELSLSDRCARSAGTRHVVDLPAVIAERGTDLDVDYVFKQSLTCPECGEPGGGLQIKERGAGS